MIWNGYTLLKDWSVNSGSETALAQKNRQKFFIKRYKMIVKPTDADSPHYVKSLNTFNAYVRERQTIMRALSSVSPRGGNMVIPFESFVCAEGMYTEVSDFVNDAVPGREVPLFMRLLDWTEKLLVMKTATAALELVHAQRIVHSDIKVDNIVVVRNDAGNFVAKLIDFDNSYRLDHIPDTLMGTINYFAPEHVIYDSQKTPKEKAEWKAELSGKTDVFSLGVTFHRWLSGTYPEQKNEKNETVYAWKLLLQGKPVPLSQTIRLPMQNLIRSMLTLEPKDRITATGVLKQLDEMSRQEKYVYQAPWPQHNLVWNVATMKEQGLTSVTKDKLGTQPVYRLTFHSGKSLLLNPEQMLTEWARKAAGYVSPRPRDAIFWNTSLLKKRGIAEIAYATSGSKVGYNLCRGNGYTAFFTVDELVEMDYARSTKASIHDADVRATGEIRLCWPEDRIVFKKTTLQEYHYSGVELYENAEGHWYRLIHEDGTKTNPMSKEQLLLADLAERA